ncbi:hypothetical protein K2173_022057 [Erythroxylum novogranatense]|uniref:Uncharacterized protein n=1 Tax=Erythroxylum novogranatense TaxID=1862640 RepID=A0AAV8T3V7_9ROSI|nr:hypothetical protein K2173_022057 [Erythroxylum novogranatense]
MLIKILFQVGAVERTPSMSEMNEILLSQEHLKQSDLSFVFRLQDIVDVVVEISNHANDSTLGGVTDNGSQQDQLVQVPWKSLGKELVIVLIDRIFILAQPATNGHALKCIHDSLNDTISSNMKSLEMTLLLETQDESQEEIRWKLVHGDAFRAPINFGLLCVYVGTGKESLVSLATEASRRALQMAEIEPDDVDMVLFCSSTPEDLFGSAPQMKIEEMMKYFKDYGIRCLLQFDAREREREIEGKVEELQTEKLELESVFDIYGQQIYDNRPTVAFMKHIVVGKVSGCS